MMEKRRGEGEEQKEEKGGKEERQLGHVVDFDTASSVKSVEKRRGEGEKQKEEKGGRRKGRLVTSRLLTLQAVLRGWRRGGKKKRSRRRRREGGGKAGWSRRPVEAVDTASSAKRVEKRRGEGEKQKEKEEGRRKGRLVTLRVGTLQAV